MNIQDRKDLTRLIKDKAREAGFDLCGIAQAELLVGNGNILKEWCDSGMNAGMNYMARNIDKRIDPALHLPGLKSVIVTGINYFSEQKQGGGDVPVLSIYTYGRDYHEVIKKKLDFVTGYIRSLDSAAECRSFVDSAPFFEKPWAVKAGLGWQGRHSVVINHRIGSFFFLGIILTTLGLEYDHPAEDRCGTCSICIGACPTGAINENRTIDAGKCIAYLTIDNKEPVAENDVEKLGGRIAGCDRCQEVCPWNRHAKPHDHPEFVISEELRRMTAEDWLNLSGEDHKKLFGNSALKGKKYEVFIQNVTNVTNSLKTSPKSLPKCGPDTGGLELI